MQTDLNSIIWQYFVYLVYKIKKYTNNKNPLYKFIQFSFFDNYQLAV